MNDCGYWDYIHYSKEDSQVILLKHKILTGKERIDSQLFFQLPTDSHRLRGHSMKVFMPRCSTTARRTFFSARVISNWNTLSQRVIEAPSVNAFKNRLERHWSDMGI